MRARFKIIAAVFACLGALIGAGIYFWHWECSPPYLEIDFLSLDRGHGIFIRLPNKHAVLVDGGESGDIIRELSNLLPFYRRYIDSIFITRPEAKYVGGLVDVLGRYSVGQIYIPKDIGTSTALDVVLSSARDKDIPIKELSSRDLVALEKEETRQSENAPIKVPSVSVKALFPDDSFKFSNASPPQLVLELLFGTTDFVFVGDASTATQNFLGKNMASTSIDVLEYANSGGASNVSEKFIRKFGPKSIIIKSSGRTTKPPQKPQFTARSFTSAKIEDIASSSVRFFSDGKKIWSEK